jgi:hypothetical protein
MIELPQLLAAVVIGSGATAVLDLWSLLLNKVFKVPSLNFCLVGRWFSLMRFGQFRHRKITNAAAQPAECALGWTMHYLTGMLFALPLVLFDAGLGAALSAAFGAVVAVQPSFFLALALGISTVFFPFLLMQPALGMGVFAANTPKPWLARSKSIVSHAVFGCGLYLTAVGYQYALGMVVA